MSQMQEEVMELRSQLNMTVSVSMACNIWQNYCWARAITERPRPRKRPRKSGDHAGGLETV